jgi:hypothetical protein
MAALGKFKLPDGREVTFDDWVEMPLYSAAYLTNVQANEVNFFNYGEGDNFPNLPVVRTSTELDTNMEKGGVIVGGEMFIFGHCIEPIESLDTAGVPTELGRGQFKETCAKALAEFKVIGKQFSQGRIVWSPAGGGIYGADFGIGAAVLSNGVPTPASIRRFTVPVHVKADNEIIRGKFRFLNGALAGALAVPADIPWIWYWRVEGLRRRPVG